MFHKSKVVYTMRTLHARSLYQFMAIADLVNVPRKKQTSVKSGIILVDTSLKGCIGEGTG